MVAEGKPTLSFTQDQQRGRKQGSHPMYMYIYVYTLLFRLAFFNFIIIHINIM